jgi:hypothetical protein
MLDAPGAHMIEREGADNAGISPDERGRRRLIVLRAGAISQDVLREQFESVGGRVLAMEQGYV